MEIITKYFSDFTDEQIKQLSSLLPLYTEWNEKINVISRKDIENFYLHHVLHSLTIATTFSFAPGSNILDLGCGGGFPGIPLAIFFPEVNFHMVDSINKKLKVVNEITQSIGLNNITVEHTRAEEIKNRKFDVVVSRAVAPLKDLWIWSKPLLKKSNHSNEDNIPNGLICLKGGDLSQEIQESGCKPFVWDIDTIFPEEHFKEKYLLYQKFK
jgi:16S rRNA (guanine527-N7)-methyltransferase